MAEPTASHSRVGKHLPTLVLLSLAIVSCGLLLLSPAGWRNQVELAAGAAVCAGIGWVGGDWWSRRALRKSIATRSRLWQAVVDELCDWIEELPVSIDDLERLKRSIDKVVR